MSNSVHKKTFSISNPIYKKLMEDETKNKSKIINEALKLYYVKKQYHKKAEEQFYKDHIEEFNFEPPVRPKDILESYKNKYGSENNKLEKYDIKALKEEK